MPSLRVTLKFFDGTVKTLYHTVDNADPETLNKVRKNFETTPQVLRLEVSDEPDYRELWKAAEAERQNLAKQLAQELKKQVKPVEAPMFAILPPR